MSFAIKDALPAIYQQFWSIYRRLPPVTKNDRHAGNVVTKYCTSDMDGGVLPRLVKSFENVNLVLHWCGQQCQKRGLLMWHEQSLVAPATPAMRHSPPMAEMSVVSWLIHHRLQLAEVSAIRL